MSKSYKFNSDDYDNASVVRKLRKLPFRLKPYVMPDGECVVIMTFPQQEEQANG